LPREGVELPGRDVATEDAFLGDEFPGHLCSHAPKAKERELGIQVGSPEADFVDFREAALFSETRTRTSRLCSSVRFSSRRRSTASRRAARSARMANQAALPPILDITHSLQKDERIRVTASSPD
jgi:hypothetical protein